MQIPKTQMKVSVRELVEFILRSGDIDNRHHAASDTAMQEGSRIHRMIQKRMGPEYQAEVVLRHTHSTEHYDLIVEGRADGIIDTATEKLIDEIKGTYRELFRIKEPNPVHLAQAKCYAYIYALRKEIPVIQVRMTYCHLETEEIRYFTSEYTFEELKLWFEGVLREYLKWADFSYDWKIVRDSSIQQVQFPFPYREGQKELVTYVYQTIYHKRKLFLEAPTGVGKTISTVFPAVKAMEKGMGDKLFYLTAKTITRTVADQTIQLLRQQGLKLKSVILTAKDKICFMEQAECNPEHCPYAKGHFDRINEAMFDLLIHEDSFDREIIEKYAYKHQVCPFEFCLDMSLYADVIIGDYNYLFDPHVYLKRFFGENSSRNYVFLIDEAHNLLERGREMYSASLVKEEFLQLKRSLQEGAKESGRSVLYHQGFANIMIKQLEKCNKAMLGMKKECEEYRLVTDIDTLVEPVKRLQNTMKSYLEETEEAEVTVKEELLDLYFKLNHFLAIYELVNDKYVKYTQLREDGAFLIKLFCVDPSTNLKECMSKGRSSILFSATFLPIQYYKSLLGGEEKDYEVYANSIFSPEKRALLVSSDVTSKYSRRTEEEFYNIAQYIHEIVQKRHGNYMVFCPSYAFLEKVYEVFEDCFLTEEMDCVLQSDILNEEDREAFLKLFEKNNTKDIENSFEEDRYLIGFCVLGGIFSEGIDLKNDSLIGAIIVGTGIPQVCYEREILKHYFNDNGGNGYDYAYRYPGMNKVLQAAGRVIRTADDIGVIALLDERFLQSSYVRLFPREWERFEAVNLKNVSKKVELFWDSWL